MSSANPALPDGSADEGLPDNDALYRSLVDGMSEGMVVQTADGIIISCNAAAERILGLSAGAMAGRSSEDSSWRVVRDDGSPFPGSEHPAMTVLRTGKAQLDVVMGVDHPDGTRRWLRADARPLGDGEGLPSAVVTTFADITVERSAIAELTVTQQRYRTLVETLPLVTYVDPIGMDGPFTFISPQVEELFGYPASEWLERPGLFMELLHPDDEERVRAWCDTTAEVSDVPARLTYRMRARDGRTVWMEDASTNVRDPQTGEVTAIGYFLDVSDEADTKRRLRSLNSRLADLIENLNAAVLVEDENRDIVLVNEEFCRTFSIPATPAELIGTNCADSAEQSKALMADPQAFVTRIDTLLDTRERVLNDEVRFADGRVFERDFVPTVIDGAYRGHLWVYRDISERHASRRALADARDEALRASRAKGDFLATMSHEIRTPMNGIVATVELLQDAALDDDGRELVRILGDAARSLQGILDDVLDFSKIESGKAQVHPESFSLAGTVRAVAELLTPAAARKGVALRTGLDPALPDALVGDPGLVRQVLLNLAGNAVKFTDEGEVAIVARVLSPGDDEVTVELQVRDTGPGIAPDALTDMFEPFVQVDASAERRHGGTGLGLAISDRLVRLMRGTLDVQSTLGEGTVFTVALPLACAAGGEVAAPAPPGPAPAEGSTLRGRVLLVEDNPINRAVGVRQLERLGLAGDVVVSGEDAVRVVRGEDWDCVLMDCQMPGMDGFAATRAIRAAEARSGRHTPIVAMTANAMHGDREECLAAGMDDYIAKPVTLATLARTLSRWLPGDADVVDEADAAATLLVRDGVDLGVLAALRKDLGDAVDGLVDMYLAELDPRVTAVVDGVAAGDGTAAAAAAHSLRGASGTYGVTALADTCMAVELAIGEGRTADLPSLVARLRDEAGAARAVLLAQRAA